MFADSRRRMVLKPKEKCDFNSMVGASAVGGKGYGDGATAEIVLKGSIKVCSLCSFSAIPQVSGLFFDNSNICISLEAWAKACWEISAGSVPSRPAGESPRRKTLII